MSNASAGRVLLIPKGDYNSGTTYSRLDVVLYEHNSYVAKQTTTGNLPTNTTYWQPLTDIEIDDTLSGSSTNAIQNKAVYDGLDEVKQTLSDVEGENVSDNEAYILRRGKGNMVDLELVGGSLAWNQLVDNGNFANTSGILYDRGTLSASNNVLSYTVTVVGTFTGSNWIGAGCKLTTNHKYLQIIDINTPKATEVRLGLWSSSGSDLDLKIFNTITTTNSWVNLSAIIPYTKDGGSACRANVGVDGSKFAINDVIKFRNFMLIDLTQLLGSTIADYIYSLEQATAGAGVAWFRKYFPNAYYAYVAESIESVNPSSRKVVGKNLITAIENGGWNTDTQQKQSFISRARTANIIKVEPLKKYTFSIATESGYVTKVKVDSYNGLGSSTFISSSDWQDVPFTYTAPSNALYVTIEYGFTVATNNPEKYTSNAQFEIGETATSYEPYKEYTFPFANKQLRGIFYLDANNKLCADGDIWKANEGITRRYNIIDLSTLAWTALSNDRWISSSAPTNIKVPASNNATINGICSNMPVKSVNDVYPADSGNGISVEAETSGQLGYLKVRNGSTTNPPTGYLVYKLATPTTESANPYQNPQSAFSDGIEEFVYDSGIAIPVGNNSVYQTSEILPLVTEYAEGVKTSVIDTIKAVVADSSDFADFQTKMAAL